MKKITILAAVVVLVGATSAVKATYVEGDLNFVGKATFDNVSTGSASSVTAWDSAFAIDGDGAFASVADFSTVVFSAPWTLNSGAQSGFLTFDGFTFDLTSSSITSQTTGIGSGASVDVSGYGTVSGNGYQSTPFSFSFTSSGQESGSPLGKTFEASISPIPDGGTTVALLGGALTVVGLIRRKLLA